MLRPSTTSGLAALALFLLACETGASDEGSTTTTCGSGCCNPGECSTGETGDGDSGDGDGEPGDGDGEPGDGDGDVDDCGCTADEFCMGGGSMVDESCWTGCLPRGEACAGVDAPCDDPECTASLCDGVPFCRGYGDCLDVPFYVNWCGDPCDPYAQDCPEGESCNPVRASEAYPWSAKCRVAGAALPGEACTLDDLALGNDTCAAGAYCYFTQLVGDVLEGTCVPLCTGSVGNPSCPDGLTCTMEDDLLGVCL